MYICTYYIQGRKVQKRGQVCGAARVQLTINSTCATPQSPAVATLHLVFLIFTTVHLASGFYVRRIIYYPSTTPPPPCTLCSLHSHAADSTKVWAAPSHKRVWLLSAASVVLIKPANACSSSNNNCSSSRSTAAMPSDQPIQSTQREHMKEHNNTNTHTMNTTTTTNNNIHQQPQNINSTSKQGVQFASIPQRGGAVRPAPYPNREKTGDSNRNTYRLQTKKRKNQAPRTAGKRITFTLTRRQRDTGKKVQGKKKIHDRKGPSGNFERRRHRSRDQQTGSGREKTERPESRDCMKLTSDNLYRSYGQVRL